MGKLLISSPSEMSTPPSTSTTATADNCSTTTFSHLHPDILESHILTRLDGPTLASASCAYSLLYSLSAQDRLWTAVCNSTWPSTATPLLRHLISTFPGGARSYFSLSFPLALPGPTTTITTSPPPPELISAVDIHYKNKLIFTKVQENETVSEWFRCSPFRIDLLEPKDVIPTAIRHPNGDSACTSLSEQITLSWVLIDPFGQRVANISSHKPVSVQQHWLSGEVHVQFSSILAGGHRRRPTSELLQCRILVTCGGSKSGEMQVKEVSLQVEDMDGMHLTGKDSLEILHRALEGKRGNRRRNYGEFLEMRRERRERKLRTERTLDMLCGGFGVTIFAAFLFFLCS